MHPNHFGPWDGLGGGKTCSVDFEGRRPSWIAKHDFRSQKAQGGEGIAAHKRKAARRKKAIRKRKR